MNTMGLSIDVDAAAAERRRWFALAVVCLAQLMLILDGSIVNIALPRIQADLHIGSAALTWVPNAYLISFGSFLLLGGRLGDLFGRTRLFSAGMIVFTAASAACGLSSSALALDAARFVQGLGAALAAPAILALIVVQFPDPGERPRVMGIYTFVSVAGASIGLLLGGVLTQALNWHWIFLINLPIGVLALAAGRAVLPRDRGIGAQGGVDVLGSILITAATMLTIATVVLSESHGFFSPAALGPLAAAVVLLAAFIVLERRVANPILPPRIMRRRTLIASCVVRGLMVVGMFTSFYLCSLDFERVKGWGPIHTGIAFLPQTLIVAVMALALTHRLVARFGQTAVMFAGIVAMAASPLILALTLHADTPYMPAIVIAFVLLGLGGGMSFVTLMGTALAGVPGEDAGIASGLINVSMELGNAIGIALLATIAAARTKTLAAGGDPATTALAGGYRFAYWFLAATVIAGLLIAVRYLRSTGAREATSAPPR
jgi:EmrB/QacA subfamily drug resistance transporter